MPEDTARGRRDAVKFALRGVGWSLGFLRPTPSELDRSARGAAFTRVQRGLAVGLFGTPSLPA